MNRKVNILQSVQALRALAVIIVMLLTSVTVWAEEITVNLGEGRGTATFSEASLMFSNCEALEVGFSFDIPLEVMTQSKAYGGVVMQNYTATLDNGETVDGTLTGEIVVGASHTYTYTVTGNEMTRQPLSVSVARTRSGDSGDVEIATWSGFRKGAASFTFDDGAPSHVNDAGPMFKKYGYKATFNLVVNWNPNWSGFQVLADEGHEIASHSNSHGNNMSGEEASSKININSKISQKYGIITVAYPNCNVPNESAVLQNYIVGRICNGSWQGMSDNMGKDGPSNWAKVPAIMTGSEGQLESTNDFTSQMQKVVQSNGWVAFLTHGFQGKSNGSATYSPTDINAIDGALKWAQQNDKDIWVAPMGHVAMYIKERKASMVEAIASTEASMTFELKHNIADNISKYNYPLSLRVKSKWKIVEVTQGGVKLESKIDGGYIYFDAIPNGGYIVVKNTAGTITPGTDVTVSGTVALNSGGTDYYDEGTTITLGYDGTVPAGYTFGGFTVTKAGGGTVSVDVTDGVYSFVMPADDVTVSATISPVSYAITYDLAGGTEATANPTTYTVESDAITLVNPTRTGYTFAGWTGTGLDAATMTVTIAKGSTGARSYTATWKKLLTITAASGTKLYDGTALTNSSYTSEGLLEGDAVESVTVTGSQTAVGTCDNVASAAVIKNGDVDVTAQYIITYVKGTLTVTTKTVSSPTITLSQTSYVYDGTAKTPTVTVKDGTTVIPDTEYTVGYSNNTAVGKATVTVTDKEGGNYTVSGSIEFEIKTADGSVTTPEAKTGLVYNGGKQDLITAGSSATGTIQYSLDGTNYATAIPQGQDAKEYTVYYKVVAKAGYKDVAPATVKVTISPKTVSAPTITLSQTSYDYDGTAKTPTVTVKDGSTTIPTSEYTVGYSDNTAVGKATVTITDKAGGNYAVSGSTTFSILSVGVLGDANGDKVVNVADIVKLVNDGAPQSDIDEVVKIIMGE